MADWALTFRQMCERRSEPEAPVTLLSNRARALIRGYAQKDADGTGQYAGLAELQKMLKDIEAEMVREYETAVERNTRLREVVGG